jgi:regulatory protein YycI of two-component signal transduction system YycFG
MDWRGVKSLLIIAFLLLNLLLAYQLWMDELNLNKFQENAEQREVLKRLAAVKEIQLGTTIPEQSPNLSEITVQIIEENEQAMSNPIILIEPIEITLIEDSRTLKARLKQQIAKIEEYELDPYALPEESGKIIMNQLFNKTPMFRIQLELVIEGNQIVAYQIRNANVLEVKSEVNELSSQGEQILSAYMALNSLVETYLPQGSTVADIRLGYYGPLFASETQVLAPYWRVTLATGEAYYVHAINGAVEGPSPLSNE